MYSGVVKCPFILFMPSRSNVISGKFLLEGEERRGGGQVEGTQWMDPLG